MEPRTVLFVDDDAELRTLGLLSLRKFGGWRTLAAASGPEALEVAAAERPDVILLDVILPGMDGPEILAALRSHPATARTPVIFLTAMTEPAEIEALRGLGAIDVITKPFDPLGLPAAVRRALGEPASSAG